MIIVDAHQDLAWNMLSFGRDYTQSVAQTRLKEADTPIPGYVGQAMLGWPDWIAGHVGIIFATIYATPARWAQPWAIHYYQEAEEAYQLFQAQLELYQALVTDHADKFFLISSRAELSAGLANWAVSTSDQRRVGLVLLVEGADGIRQPSELPYWYGQGVRIIGPAWAATRYAGGTGEPGPFTEAGQALLQKMAELGLILDLSHLTDEAVEEALDCYPGTIIASHSNARALLSGNDPQRHLSDRTIRHVAARGGVIGVVLPNDFIKNGVRLSDPRCRVSLDDVVVQIDYSCQLVGGVGHIGFGK